MFPSRSATLRHRRHSTPLGEVLIVASDRGVVAVSLFPDETESSLRRTNASLPQGRRPSERPLASELLDQAAEQLDEYFAGERTWFSLPLDLLPTLPPQAGLSGARAAHAEPSPFVSPTAPFLSEVQLALLRIPYGQTRTYGQIAKELGRPGAARAVGSACARNPLAILIPCHRVTAAKGPGGYAGGPELKELLLRLERPEA